MAEIIVNAALEALYSVLATRTLDYIGDQSSLADEVGKQMRDIEKELKKIQDLLSYADKKMETKENNDLLGNWVRNVRDVAYKVEDIVDSHEYDLAEKKHGRRRTLKKTSDELKNIQRPVKEIVDTYNRLICEELRSNPTGQEGSSSYDLPAYLKQCFLYCCCTFPENCTFLERYIIDLWVAEGFIKANEGRTLEETGKAYLKELVGRSMMIQKFDADPVYPEYKIHDAFRAVGLDISKRQMFGALVDKDSEDYPRNTRRLSIYKPMDKNIPDLPKLRTLYVRGSDYFSVQNFELLKVLDLEGIPMSHIPEEIFKLFILRHLNLKNTGIKKRVFPSEVEKLPNLLYLNISKTGVKSLPGNIRKLGKLRTLLCGDFDQGIGIQVPVKIFDLKDLQCLKYIEANGMEQLGNLTQLRELGIIEVKKHSHEKQLCSLLKRMVHLKDLEIITAKDEKDPINLQSLNHTQHPRRLERLFLKGAIKGISTWCKSLQNLRYLEVNLNYKLKEGDGDALLFDSLKSLPYLEVVTLTNFHMVTKLSFPKSCFPSLRELLIKKLYNLTSLEMEHSALPNLRRIRIYSCPKLIMIPPKANLPERLEEIRMEYMPRQVVKQFQEMCAQSNVELIFSVEIE